MKCPYCDAELKIKQPESEKLISAWGYVGYMLLFSIPLVGFILILVFSFGGTAGNNLKNFARSYLCIMLIGVIIAVLTLALGMNFIQQISYHLR